LGSNIELRGKVLAVVEVKAGPALVDPKIAGSESWLMVLEVTELPL
jgi:hypothetical protein